MFSFSLDCFGLVKRGDLRGEEREVGGGEGELREGLGEMVRRRAMGGKAVAIDGYTGFLLLDQRIVWRLTDGAI